MMIYPIRLTVLAMLSILNTGLLHAEDNEFLVEYTEDVSRSNAKTVLVSIEVGAAQLLVHTADMQQLAKLNIRHAASRVPDVSYLVNGSHGELLVSNTNEEGGSSWGLFSMEDGEEADEWDLVFCRDLPMDLEVNFGLGSGEVDLGAMELNSLEFATGLSDVVLDFSSPCSGELEKAELATGLGKMEVRGLANAPFSKLDFSGGLGSAILDFSGQSRQDMDIQLDVGMGSLVLLIPEDFGVKIKHQENFFSKSEFADLEKVGNDTWYSENWQEAAGNLTLVLSVGMGSVRLERIAP